jgi:hypothetical protein
MAEDAAMIVKDCPVAAIHTYQVRTLRSLGYATRVALANKSHLRPELRTDYRVDLSIYANGAGRTRFVENLGTLVADGRLAIDCAPYEVADRDITLVFHLVPVRLTRATADVDRDELMFLASVQDHYVEYYRPDGVAAGILYQTGPFNHPVFSPKSTTLIQAPKYYASTTLDSLLSVLNASSDPAYARTARLQCRLVGDHGSLAWTEDIPAFEPRTISMREALTRNGVKIGDAPTFACFYGLCDNATVVPLTIVRNTTTGAIGLEHSLPPDYYSPPMRGPARATMMQRLRDSTLFGVRE